MRRGWLFLLLVTVALCSVRRAAAQYYTWGSDPPQKWSTIRTPDVRMIYPDTVSALARRTLCYIRTVQPDIGYGFRHGPMRIPFVMHPENFQSNGLVMYLPKRVEFLTSPAIDSYSMPWYKQLVAHEYRHAVQYNNLDRGLIRVLSYLLGQQGSTIGLLCMPIWAMEGDAVMSETMMSSFGRGLQPSFSMAYRAMGSVGRDRRNIDRWFCGSYRDHIPDHYELGYQICSYAWERYGENIWDKVAWYGSRNPYVLFTTSVSLRKFYGTNVSRLFRETFDELGRFWDSLPKEDDSARPLVGLPERNYTTYQWPLALGDTAVVALKTDLDRVSRFVRIDRRTGEERTIAPTGLVSTRPTLCDGRLWWTEYRRSTLFEQRVNSQLCYMDLADGRPRTAGGERRVLYPTSTPDELGWVEYNPDGRYAVVVRRDGAGEQRFAAPDGKELHGLAWDDLTRAWYVLVTDDSGMWIGRIDAEGLHAVTEGAYITLSDLRAGGGRLYYGSIASGKDEAHCYDLTGRREYRITTSAYGSFDPAPAGGDVLVTTYDRLGYRVAEQPSDSALIPVAASRLPENRVNPPRRRWEVVNLDTVRFTRADSLAQSADFRSKRYRKLPNLVNVHSWMPVAFNPFALVDEQTIDLNAGVTVISQNLLSNTEAYASYGWNRHEGSLVNLGVRYFGLGVRFELDASYGGNQLFYSLGAVQRPDREVRISVAPGPRQILLRGADGHPPALFPARVPYAAVLGLGWLELFERHGGRSGQDRVGCQRRDHQHPAHRFPQGAASGGIRRRILRPGADGPPRHCTPLGLHPLDELHVQSGEQQLQRPDFVLRAGLPAGCGTPQLAVGGGDLSDVGRRVQVPDRLCAAELQVHAADPAGVLLGGHRLEQLHGPGGQLPAAGVVSRGRHRLGALLQADPAQYRGRLRLFPDPRDDGHDVV